MREMADITELTIDQNRCKVLIMGVRRYTQEDEIPYPLNWKERNWPNAYNNFHLWLPGFHRRNIAENAARDDININPAWIRIFNDVDQATQICHLQVDKVLWLNRLRKMAFKGAARAGREKMDEELAEYLDDWCDYFTGITMRMLAPVVVYMIEEKHHKQTDIML